MKFIVVITISLLVLLLQTQLQMQQEWDLTKKHTRDKSSANSVYAPDFDSESKPYRYN